MANQARRLRQRLERSRGFSARLLEDFSTAEEWTRQLHEGGNHAVWFVGHMGTTDNFMISILDPDRAEEREDYSRSFGMGSEPSAEITDYAPVEELLSFMVSRREVLLEILDGLDEKSLERETPEGTPGFMPDYASVFETAIWHEALHSGQLSMIRRALGHAPIV